MDAYQGVDITSEITHNSIESSNEELSTEEDGCLHLDEIYDQLEEMKQRALQLRKALLGEQSVLKEYAKCLQDIEQNCSQHAEVRQVQLLTAHIAGQAAILAQRLTSERQQLKDLDCRQQQIHQRTQKLHTYIEKLHKWPQRVQHQMGICLERYNDVTISYCTDKDSIFLMDEFYKSLLNGGKTKVQLKCFQADRRYVVERLKKTSHTMRASTQLLLTHSNALVGALHNYIDLGGVLHIPMNFSSSDLERELQSSDSEVQSETLTNLYLYLEELYANELQ